MPGGRRRFIAGSLAGDERGADGACKVGPVASRHLGAYGELEGSQNRVRFKRAALHDDGVAERVDLVRSYNAEKRVVHDRISDARRDVFKRGSDLLGMANARVHENRAAGS